MENEFDANLLLISANEYDQIVISIQFNIGNVCLGVPSINLSHFDFDQFKSNVYLERCQVCLHWYVFQWISSCDSYIYRNHQSNWLNLSTKLFYEVLIEYRISHQSVNKWHWTVSANSH